MCQYGPNKEDNILKLDKLKPRRCIVDVKKIMALMEVRNRSYDTYQDLDTFFIPNITFAKAFIKIAKKMNSHS